MKYCIMHIDNRAKDLMDYNKSILKDFEYVEDIKFFNGNLGNAWDVLNHKKIKLDAWSPYDGRTMPPLPGEFGVWVSTINVWEYIIDKKIDKLLVLEDDIKIQPDFIKNFNLCIKNLPEDFDFLSLHYFNEQNKSTEDVDFGSEYLQRSFNQYSAGQAIVYSLAGAKKLLKVLKRKGIEYTTDCFIFRQGLENLVNGYSIKPDVLNFLEHKNKEIPSTIDPENVRNT